jgi:hypothetical protein
MYDSELQNDLNNLHNETLTFKEKLHMLIGKTYSAIKNNSMILITFFASVQSKQYINIIGVYV